MTESMLQLSESARAMRADESRFRIAAPNSRPPTFRVIALDGFCEVVAQQACEALGANVAYRRAGAGDDDAGLADWLAGADVVALLARAGTDPAPAARVAGLCRPRGIMVTGLVIEPLSDSEPGGQATIAGLRPHCSMLVIASDTEYVGEMLEALGAR